MDKNIDPRLIVPSYINKPDVRFFDAAEAPFGIYGVKKDEKGYLRLSEDIAGRINSRARKFSSATAGGRVRFKTDSTYIAIRVHLGDIYRISMLTLTASAGFDLYEDERFLGSFNPPYEIQSGGVYEAVVNLGERRERELTVNMPSYSSVIELEIGIDGDATLSSHKKYKVERPIVFYGSSITHGACASRPGLTFPLMLSRRLDADIVNLGFGAGCRGETEIARYIGELEASAFVCAYDHNAPNKEKLAETHEAFFKALRSQAPKLPVVFVSRPDIEINEEGSARFSVIKRTYDNAISEGDDNVYLLDGISLLDRSELTNDGIHPNDIGEKVIADRLEIYLRKMLKM